MNGGLGQTFDAGHLTDTPFICSEDTKSELLIKCNFPFLLILKKKRFYTVIV